MLPPVDLNIQLLKKISRGWNLILDPRSKTERNGTSWHKWSRSSISSSKISVKTCYLAGCWSWVQHCICSCRMSVFFIVAGAAKIANLCQRFNVVTLNQRWFWRCPIWEWQSSPCPVAIGHGLPANPPAVRWYSQLFEHLLREFHSHLTTRIESYFCSSSIMTIPLYIDIYDIWAIFLGKSHSLVSSAEVGRTSGKTGAAPIRRWRTPKRSNSNW